MSSTVSRNMSINDAHALLWQRSTLPTTAFSAAFSAFKKPILQELSARNSIVVAQPGAKKTPLKSDYIQALCEFVSQLVASPIDG